MRCEIVAVGTELLLGQIVDTNSAWLGEQLALAGIDCTHEQTVGDNLERIVGALGLALGRADAVIVCGGLGPTQDDITRNAIAQVMGVRLVQDDDIVDRILERFAARGRRMPANNLLQAQVPEGARKTFSVQHPTGEFTVVLEMSAANPAEVARASLLRTARLLMRGEVFIPGNTWPGQ